MSTSRPSSHGEKPSVTGWAEPEPARSKNGTRRSTTTTPHAGPGVSCTATGSTGPLHQAGDDGGHDRQQVVLGALPRLAERAAEAPVERQRLGQVPGGTGAALLDEGELVVGERADVGDVEADHQRRSGPLGVHDHGGGRGVVGDVGLGAGLGVAGHEHRATHDHETVDAPGPGRVGGDPVGDVGERPDGDEGERLGGLGDQAGEQLVGGLVDRAVAGRRHGRSRRCRRCRG